MSDPEDERVWDMGVSENKGSLILGVLILRILLTI